MGLAYEYTLNPQVSIFRHKSGIYLFDPASCTCASMNEAMLAFITKADADDVLYALSKKDRRRLIAAVEKLRELDILVEKKKVSDSSRRTIANGFESMTNLAIFVTTTCNLRCTYCYAQGGDTNRTISRDIWSIAMDYFFSDLGAGAGQKGVKPNSVSMAIHGGGEPTVEFETLKEIVAGFCRKADAVGLRPFIDMVTNGTYDESVHQWILENNISVTISLDGPRDIQNSLRPFRSGRPSYDVVLRNVKSLIKAGKRVPIRATVTSESLDTMVTTVKLAKQVGISEVHLEPVSQYGRCAMNMLIIPDAERFAENFLKSFLTGLKLGVAVRYSGMRCFEHYHKQFCCACGQNFCVTPDGNITMCYEVLDPSDPAASTFFVGKVDTIHRGVVIDQDRIKKLKLRVTNNMEVCTGCLLRYHCAGDCLIRSFRYSKGDLYTPDPYRCKIADRVNKQLIAWLADGVIESPNQENTRVFSLNY
jgi:uncharacterized protein